MESKKLEKLINLIKTGEVKYIVGIEKDGERDFIKSDYSACLIGAFYRKSLKEEKPVVLTNKVLPFPEFWDQVAVKENIKDELLFPDFREGMHR